MNPQPRRWGNVSRQVLAYDLGELRVGEGLSKSGLFGLSLHYFRQEHLSVLNANTKVITIDVSR